MGKTGVLPKQTLRELLASGCLSGITERYLNPASIDLPLAEEAYRLESIFLPLHEGEKVRDLLPTVGATPHRFDTPLEVGVPYLFRIAGEWKLPSMVYGYANPKSSTGRIGFFCRTIADGIDMYDALFRPGWSGELWLLARPDYFPVLLQPGLALSQMRLFDGKSFLDDLHTELAIGDAGLAFDEGGKKLSLSETRRHDNSFMLTIHVEGMTGWECRGTRKVLDMSKTGFYDPADFFEPVCVSNGKYILRKNCFYILTTRERIKVPPYLSAELRAIEPRLGEFRSHAAGYIDPGWGCGADGEGCGRPITLEVIPQEDTLIRHGQRIARLRYEYMKSVPEVRYDDSGGSHYSDQETARLSKHFKKPVQL
ncbi:MAG: 2'-deoxycytidine 5'-triphosphate deaminase [Patescibacteria group bacterium]|nr:2'-deoxycytidine 5'-triphosphate deaminase [Patescibacteria group bacterium]